MGDHVKGLTEFQVDDISNSSLVKKCSYAIIEGHWVGQAGCSHSDAMLVVSYHLPLFHVPYVVEWDILQVPSAVSSQIGHCISVYMHV